MPKTGTTSLQSYLRKNANFLRQNGVLYPRPDLRTHHNFLNAGMPGVDRVPRQFAQRFTRGDHVEYVDALRTEIAEAASSIHTVIISSEHMFRVLTEEDAEVIRSLLPDTKAVIEFMVYVRNPGDRYISAMQQVLKASTRILRPQGLPCRPQIESFQRLGMQVVVKAFSRDSLYRKDVAQDFVRTTLNIAGTDIPGISESRLNETISAEGMCILLNYRRKFNSQQDNILTEDSKALFDEISAVEKGIGGVGRPRLLPNVRTLIESLSKDLLWLKSEYGVTFPEIDYSRIGNDQIQAPRRPHEIADVCEVDPDVLNTITAHLLRRLVVTREQ